MFNPMTVHMGFAEHKVALGQVGVLLFSAADYNSTSGLVLQLSPGTAAIGTFAAGLSPTPSKK
jgi:hypothetical protein